MVFDHTPVGSHVQLYSKIFMSKPHGDLLTYVDTAGEFISFVCDFVLIFRLQNRYHFIVSTRLCIFDKSILYCLFMINDYWDVKLVTNYKNPCGFH